MSRRRLLFAAVDGLQLLRRRAWLRRSQWYPPERLRAFQEARLRHIVQHAYAHSPFYRQRFDAASVRPSDIHTLDDLQRIPVLRRQDVAAHKARITADNARRFRPESGSTSGTTGARVEFLRDKQTVSVANAAILRVEGWHGIPWRHRRAEIRIIRGTAEPIAYAVRFGCTTLQINLASPRLEPSIVAPALVAFKPELIMAATPTWATYLATYLLAHREHTVRPKAVFTRGERLFPEQRAALEEAFGSRVVDLFGTLEFIVFGAECERGRMHAAAEMGIIEVLRNGRRCPAGEAGELVMTSLWNHSFPFIRYATDDVASLDPDRCPCGRGLPTWRILGGRYRDLIATAQGYLFPNAAIVAVPRWLDKIAGLRFLQHTRGAVIAQVVRGPRFVDADRDVLAEELCQQFHNQVAVSVEFCDSIEQTTGGKYRLVVSKVPVTI